MWLLFDLFAVYHCELNIFLIWTLGQTKQTTGRHKLWEIDGEIPAWTELKYGRKQ